MSAFVPPLCRDTEPSGTDDRGATGQAHPIGWTATVPAPRRRGYRRAGPVVPHRSMTTRHRDRRDRRRHLGLAVSAADALESTSVPNGAAESLLVGAR